MAASQGRSNAVTLRAMASSQGRSSALAVVLCVILLAQSGIQTASAVRIVVGGQAGWNLGRGYGALSAKRGDVLVFNYNRQAHNVIQVNSNDFNSCNVRTPSKTFRSGKDSVKLTSPGTYYFTCGVPGHCGGGMKVAVTVK